MDFLKYLEEWENTVAQRNGYTGAEKTMLLSVETSTGLKLTGMWRQSYLYFGLYVSLASHVILLFLQ